MTPIPNPRRPLHAKKEAKGLFPCVTVARGEQETWTRRGNARHMAHAMRRGPRMAGFVDAVPHLTRKSSGDVMPHSARKGVRHKRNLRSPTPFTGQGDPSSMCTLSVSTTTTPPAILLNTPTPVHSMRNTLREWEAGGFPPKAPLTHGLGHQ